LPSGWTTDVWDSSPTNSAGGTSPEAHLWYNAISGNYSYLDSNPVDTTGLTGLTLEFKSYIDAVDSIGDIYNCRVLTSTDGFTSSTDVTPWDNPITDDVGPGTYLVDISSDIGTATQVRFEFEGIFAEINDWYVDDVRICGVPEQAVGGVAYPINKVGLLAPWIALAVVIAVGGVYLIRRRA
jgi:hypothetical protein